MQYDRISHYRRSSHSSIDSSAAWSLDEDYQLALLVLHFIPLNLAWVFFNTRSNLSYASYTERYNLMEMTRSCLIGRRAPPSSTHEVLPSFNRVAKQMHLCQFDLLANAWKGTNPPPIVSNLTQLLQQSNSTCMGEKDIQGGGCEQNDEIPSVAEQNQSPPKSLDKPEVEVKQEVGEVKPNVDQQEPTELSNSDAAKLACLHAQLFSEQDHEPDQQHPQRSSEVDATTNGKSSSSKVLTDDDLMNRINQLAELDSSKSQLDVSFERADTEDASSNQGGPDNKEEQQQQPITRPSTSSCHCGVGNENQAPTDVSIDDCQTKQQTNGRIRATFKRMASYTRRRHKNRHTDKSQISDGCEDGAEVEEEEEKEDCCTTTTTTPNRASTYTTVMSGARGSWRRSCSTRVSSLGNNMRASSVSSGFWSLRGRPSTVRGLEA